MIDARLPAMARAAGVTLAASVIAVPEQGRLRAVASLVADGYTVHVDVIGGAYRGQRGVQPAELATLSRLPSARLDVHLMVDDPLTVIGVLPQDLHRITVQPSADIDLGAVVHAAGRRADETWVATYGDDGAGDDAALLARAAEAGAAGVLVMLTPPGQAGHRADLRRLAVVRQAVEYGLQSGVDGGVNVDTFPRVAASGISYAVAGRGLWS